MWDALLARVKEQAERSGPSVRAGALLRIARVYSAADKLKSRTVFESAVDEIRSFSGRERHIFLEEARLIAAAIAPELIATVPFVSRPLRPFAVEKISRIMLENGYIDAAFDYVMACEDPAEFPYLVVWTLLPKLVNQEQRDRLLRKAIAVGRKAPTSHFISFFSWHWSFLPSDEARDAVRDIVRVAIEQPDRPITAAYDSERTVEITSNREHIFFEMLHILRRLDNALAESLIERYHQLARAAQYFPRGTDSIREAVEQRRKEMPPGETCGGGYAMLGNPNDFPYMRSLLKATKTGDFEPPMSYAQEKYQADTSAEDPNQAPKYFWPSASAFRQILYEAGKRIGENASAYLSRIADDDLRLFAEIELLAALAGLQPFQSPQWHYHPAWKAADRGEAMPGVRCPKCSWQPHEKDRWACKCGHAWNTFETCGLCPACSHQWEVTACFGCGAVSPHLEWYDEQQ